MYEQSVQNSARILCSLGSIFLHDNLIPVSMVITEQIQAGQLNEARNTINDLHARKLIDDKEHKTLNELVSDSGLRNRLFDHNVDIMPGEVLGTS